MDYISNNICQTNMKYTSQIEVCEVFIVIISRNPCLFVACEFTSQCYIPPRQTCVHVCVYRASISRVAYINFSAPHLQCATRDLLRHVPRATRRGTVGSSVIYPQRQPGVMRPVMSVCVLEHTRPYPACEVT